MMSSVMAVLRRVGPGWLAGLLLAAPAGAEPPAAALFGAREAPTASAAAPLGSYARGCLAGAAELSETAPGWQAMRLSRNRNWGHPALIAFIGRLSDSAREIGWPGLYVGDIGQPRGGPMNSGPRSHQIGLDADIWLRRPGPRPLSDAERERIGSINVVAANGADVNENWTPQHHRLIRAAAEDTAVARIFVNAAIKRAMCQAERGPDGRIDAPWLRKVRPWTGHDHHFHVRLACPPGAQGCRDQAPPPPGDGCGAELAHWFPGGTRSLADPTAGRHDEEAQEAEVRTRSLSGELTLDDLPPACSAVVEGDAPTLASLAPAAPVSPAQPPAPVFAGDRAEAHAGFIGTRYFWIPPVDRTAAERRGVALKVEGDLPPGLEFQDRGGGNGLLSGVPGAAGSWTFDIVAHTRGAQEGRLVVTVPVEQLRAGTAEAAELAAQPSLEYRVRDFVANFAGDECFHAAPVTVAAARIEVEAFADDAAPFHDFDAAFGRAMGTEARIGGRLVTPAQCAALAFAGDFPQPAPPRVALSDPDHVLAPGQPLEATITGEAVRYVTPLLVRPDGSVADLSARMTREGAALKIAATVPGAGPHLLVLADTAFPLLPADYGPTGPTDLLSALRDGNARRSYDLRVSLAYFVGE